MSAEAVAVAHPNIALVKYWGKRDRVLNLPSTPSLSVTLDTYRTRTRVRWGAERDLVVLNDRLAYAKEASRVLRLLDLIDPDRPPCEVHSDNNFPTAAGLASSSSGFAALALAATRAAGRALPVEALSALARRGSGSATRSLWGGWVVWRAGTSPDGSDSHGVPLAPRDHWDIRMVVAMVASGQKAVGSTEGMIRTEQTSPFYPAWVETAPADLMAATYAVQARDLAALGEVMERSTLKMHGTMLTATPPVRYWKPATTDAMDVVEDLRRQGIGAYYTMDAGPNVKVLCEARDAPSVEAAIRSVVPDVVTLGVGGDATLEET